MALRRSWRSIVTSATRGWSGRSVSSVMATTAPYGDGAGRSWQRGGVPLLAPTPRRPRWHRLVVSGVESAGPDLVIVTLDVPEEARDAFIRYDAGQCLTVRVDTPGGPASRSYSIATAPSNTSTAALKGSTEEGQFH